VGHVELSGVCFDLPDGRPLLTDISFRVGDGAVVALVGANGSGKTPLTRIISGELDAHEGTVSRSGGLGVMRQFIGSIRDESTVRDLLFSLSPPRIAAAADAVDALELALMDDDSEELNLAYAAALAEYADGGGYDHEVLFDACCMAALDLPWDKARWRETSTLSGGEQKRLALEVLLRGHDEVLLLDEPDNYLDVPAKRWLEGQLRATRKTVLLVSHDRELLANAATAIAALELGGGGNTLWVHVAGFATFADARADRFARFEELRRRWDEEQEKLRALVLMYKQKAAYNDGLASRYQAGQDAARQVHRSRSAPGGAAAAAGVDATVGRPAGPPADPAAGAGWRNAAAPGRAHRQPRHRVGGGPRTRPGGLRWDGDRRDARPLVRPRVRSLPGVRLGRRRLRGVRTGLGRGARGPRPVSRLAARQGAG